jgi:hypothetical protein
MKRQIFATVCVIDLFRILLLLKLLNFLYDNKKLSNIGLAKKEILSLFLLFYFLIFLSRLAIYGLERIYSHFQGGFQERRNTFQSCG